MAKLNAGNWGAFLQGGVQGAQTEQAMEGKDLQNRYMKNAMVDPAAQENQYWTQQRQQNQMQNGQQPWQDQGRLFDPVRNKLADVYQSAKARLSSFLPGQGQHAMGPSSQPTVPQQTNVAMSAPQPSSSNSASGGLPGATGPMPLPQSNAQVSQPQPFADGGIPARGRSGALRQRKTKPGNIAKPSKAAQAAMHPPMEKPPVDAQEMGAEGGPPGNTEAQPGSQDPMLADGGQLNIKKAIKHPGALHADLGVPQGQKIPKAKLDAAAKQGGKTGQRARFAETLRKFDDGGMVNVARGDAQTAADRHPWDPDAAEADIKADQKTSDRLSSPNHRLPVTKTPMTQAGTRAAVHPDNEFANGGMVDKPMPFKPPAMPKPNPNMVEKDVGNDGQRNRLGKTIKRFADGGGPPTDPIERAAANRAAKPAAVSSSTTNAVNDTTAASEAPASGLEAAEPVPKGVLGRLKGVGKAATGAYVAGQTAAGVNDALHSSTSEYANRNSIDQGDPNTWTGKAKNLGINTLGALEDVSNRIIPGVARWGTETAGPTVGGWLSGDPNPATAPGSWDNRAPAAAPTRPGAEQIPVYSKYEAKQIQDSGGFLADGTRAPAHFMIDTQDEGGPSYAIPPRGAHGGGAAGPVPGPAAPPEQGPPNPNAGQAPQGAPTPMPAANAPLDFSNVNIDHQDIPTTTAHEWDKMKQGIIEQLIATRKAGPQQAAMMADDQVSQFQHQNFVQYMQQGIALDRAGNKQGAMAALKTAYQYMPTGHDMSFGVDPKTNSLVGFGVDEDTKKPIGQPVLLDQANLNHLLATYSNPSNFQAESLAMQEQKRKNIETLQGQVPYMQAHAGLAGAQTGYFQGRNDTMLEAAAIRHAAAGGSKLPPQTQKFYAQQLNGSIVDPREQGEALGVAETLEHRYGNDPQTQGKIVGLLKQMYSMPIEQRQEFAMQNKIPLPSLTQEAPMDQSAMYGMYGTGIPPR